LSAPNAESVDSPGLQDRRFLRNLKPVALPFRLAGLGAVGTPYVLEVDVRDGVFRGKIGWRGSTASRAFLFFAETGMNTMLRLAC
jgi:hypothetical protein